MTDCEWRNVTLAESAFIDVGFPFKSAHYTDGATDVRLLRGDNIAQGGLRWNGVRRWPSNELEIYAKYMLAEQDIVVAMDRPWIEAGLKFSRISKRDLPCLLVQRVARLRAKKGISQEFLFYVIGSSPFEDHIKAIITGVNVPHISARDMASFSFLLPPQSVQRRVTDILFPYDDLIELNRQRITILEEMAKRLFEEWFVHFRYPGHAAVPLIKTHSGVSPMGWASTRLGQILTLNYGRALKAENRMMGGVPVYGSSGIIGTHNSFLVEGPGIIVGRKGNVGSVHWASSDFFPIDTVFYVASSYPLRWIYQLLKKQRFMNSDAAVPGLKREQAYAVEVISAPISLTKHFSSIVDPLLSKAEVLAQQNIRLRAARNLLLPKLISGEIDVSRAERRFAEAAE